MQTAFDNATPAAASKTADAAIQVAKTIDVFLHGECLFASIEPSTGQTACAMEGIRDAANAYS